MELKEFGNIQYLTSGFEDNKHSLIFIHGFPDNLYVWKSVISRLKNDFNILSLGAPGCFRYSSVSIKDFKLNDLSEKYFQIIQQNLGASQKIIVAHDMGGGYAHKLVEHLGADTKIICVNTLPGQLMLRREKAIRQFLKSSYMVLFQLPLERIGWMKKKWKNIVDLIHKAGQAKNNFPEEYNENVLNGFMSYKAMFRSIPEFLYQHKYQNSALFIWGKLDPFLIEPTESELEEYYFNWEKIVLDCGHWPMLDEVDRVVLEIKKFSEKEDV